MLPLDDQRTDVIDDPLFYNRETYYDTIILLVRSPFDAMLAEFARCGLKDSKRAYTKKEELQAGNVFDLRLWTLSFSVVRNQLFFHLLLGAQIRIFN